MQQRDRSSIVRAKNQNIIPMDTAASILFFIQRSPNSTKEKCMNILKISAFVRHNHKAVKSILKVILKNYFHAEFLLK